MKSIDIAFPLSVSARPYQPGSPLPIRTLSEVKQVRGVVLTAVGDHAGRPGLQGPVLRFFCIALFSSLFSFIYLKFSRFSLCSPSFYVPHSLSHRRFMYASMRRKRSLRADWGHFRSDGTPRGQHPP